MDPAALEKAFEMYPDVKKEDVVLKDGTDADITGKIVALEKADPGYD